MAAGEPSEDYQWVLIPDEFDAFRTKEAAVKEAKRRWANQQPGERAGWFTAKIQSYLEPDYEIDVDETPIGGGASPRAGGGAARGRGGGARARPARGRGGGTPPAGGGATSP